MSRWDERLEMSFRIHGDYYDPLGVAV